ncbi:glycosyltransferase family 2 protein [Kitasatospora kifunensis]|uniref:Cellulose synthase/poly-beta-1,6-N-acetylglucosamine synthase-like glycosyltransferase n=1 Tax=Kitasatospora kifunensis TaxID=58351 RepID=A0A7W7QX83_KITKI|nr:glycosyltransferase [Kitasatospora kifunensis]MBB4921490.1 cellulose synthase/poly-beta-1,6-N-acetylglucosamine synthase-like glycosyltransferase [Kitasatospora kifunensis]
MTATLETPPAHRSSALGSYENAQPPAAYREPGRLAVWGGRAALAGGGAGIAWYQPGPLLPLATLLLGVCLAWVGGWHGRSLRLIALALAVYVSAVDYLSWRLSVLSWSGWWIGLPLFLAELHAAVHTVGLHVTIWPRRPEPPRLDQLPCRQPVFVFVPTVDEGTAIVGETLAGILAARERYLAEHPHASITVVVCNDGGVAGADCSAAVIALCERLGVICVTRTVGGGAKAGNIEHARQLLGATGDALLVVFDADQVPREEFFLRSLAPLADSRVGWVQSGQFYGNRENPVARWADDQQSLFYRLLCPGKALHDSAFICGTNVVLRAAALDEIGGLPTDSVTEDFAASIRLAPRWRSVYLTEVLAVGLGPVDLASYLKQQERWARGTLSVLRSHWRDLLLPRRGGLRAGQRLQYGLAVTHYLSGIRDLVFLLAPVLYLATGATGVRGATLGSFLAHFAPYYLLASVAFAHAAWRTTSWRSIVVGFGSFPALIRAAWMTLIGNHGRFTLTPKRRTAGSAWRTARWHLVSLSACAGALVLAVTVHRQPAYYLAAFWLAYLCVLTGLYLSLVRQDARAAAAPAAEASVARVVRGEEPRPVGRGPRHRARQLPPRVRKMLPAGALACVLAVVAGSAVVSSAGDARASAGPAPTALPGRPRVGLTSVTDSQLAMLQKSLGLTSMGLRGRTDEIDAQFDTGWATAAGAGGGVPWQTLVLSRHGQPQLDSSLTAVANGSDDAALRRWAREIARYAKPVYLTVLPEADRNYAASSAVARGGIPQDVGPAWSRIRQLFHDAGATNVGWVWGPADPGHDQPYTPPAQAVDAVAVTLFEYPGTSWADPARALASAAAAHPGKPLLVDVSLAGAPEQRAAWLEQLGAALAARRDVAGLVYQETGPELDPSGAAAHRWSLTADPLTAEAAGRLLRTIAIAGGS